MRGWRRSARRADLESGAVEPYADGAEPSVEVHVEDGDPHPPPRPYQDRPSDDVEDEDDGFEEDTLRQQQQQQQQQERAWRSRSTRLVRRGSGTRQERARSAESAPVNDGGERTKDERRVESDSESVLGQQSLSSSRKSLKHRSWLRPMSWGRLRGDSSGSARSTRLGLDPAFVEDIKASLLEYSRLIARRRGVGEGLYNVPETTHNWGEKQKEHHVNWADLFFDLIYVAVAFQQGLLLTDMLEQKRWEALFYFYVTLGALYECWSLKLHYSCRFNSDDIAHKVFDIVEALLVALTAGHLSTSVADLEDQRNGQLLGLCVFKLAHQLFHLLRWLELWAFGDRRSVHRQARVYSTELLIGTVPLIAAVALSALGMPPLSVIAALFGSSVLQVLHEVLRLYNRGLRRNFQSWAVPMHVEYCVHRYGEWTMLMLGEGVMQIILSTFAQSTARYATYTAAYLLMAALRVLFYSSQPFKAQGHALNQSLRRGFIWLQLQPLKSCLIICVGIGLKSALKRAAYLSDPEYQHYQWFLCIAVSLLMTLIWMNSLLHQGLEREFTHLPRRIRNLKIFTYIWKFGLSGALLVVPTLMLEAWVTVSLCLLTATLQIITHDVWHRLSKENEMDSSYLQGLGLIEGPLAAAERRASARKSNAASQTDAKGRPRSPPGSPRSAVSSDGGLTAEDHRIHLEHAPKSAPPTLPGGQPQQQPQQPQPPPPKQPRPSGLFATLRRASPAGLVRSTTKVDDLPPGAADAVVDEVSHELHLPPEMVRSASFVAEGTDFASDDGGTSDEDSDTPMSQRELDSELDRQERELMRERERDEAERERHNHRERDEREWREREVRAGRSGGDRRNGPAPATLLLLQHNRMQQSMRSTFRFGRFNQDGPDEDLKRELHRLFHQHGYAKLEQGLSGLVRQHGNKGFGSNAPSAEHDRCDRRGGGGGGDRQRPRRKTPDR